MANYKGCFYWDNGEYTEISYAEHTARHQNDSSYAKRRFVGVSGYLLEVPIEEHKRMMQELERRRYLRQTQGAFTVVSLYACTSTHDPLLELIADAESPSVEDTVIGKLQAEELQQVLQILNASELATYKALFVDGLTEIEYGEMLGISQQAASRRKHQLLSRLRDYYGVKY